MYQKQPDEKQSFLVLEMPQYKNVAQTNIHSDPDSFRSKYLLMLQLKFSIFVKSITLVYWKIGGAKLDFYSN